jgi:hypothetical protein
MCVLKEVSFLKLVENMMREILPSIQQFANRTKNQPFTTNPKITTQMQKKKLQVKAETYLQLTNSLQKAESFLSG